MLEPINVWMDSKDAFDTEPFFKSSDVAIVPNKSLVSQRIAQIRLALWFSFIIPMFQKNIDLAVWVMFLTCVKCWQ